MKTAIVTSFDKNYIVPSQVSLKSLSNNYSGSEPLNVVCLVSPDILDYQDKYIDQINTTNLNIEFRCSPDFLSMMDSGSAHSSKYISSHCNHRIFLGSTLSDYDRAIYIDSDIVVCRNIQPLLEYKTNSVLSAIIEFHNMNEITFKTSDMPYFNNGVFIADLEYWRESGAEGKMLKFINENGPTLCPEQDAMNYAFADVLSPLPFSFNTFHYWMSDPGTRIFAVCNSNPLIVHFAGEDKPWNTELDTKWSELWHNTYSEILEG